MKKAADFVLGNAVSVGNISLTQRAAIERKLTTLLEQKFKNKTQGIKEICTNFPLVLYKRVNSQPFSTFTHITCDPILFLTILDSIFSTSIISIFDFFESFLFWANKLFKLVFIVMYKLVFILIKHFSKNFHLSLRKFSQISDYIEFITIEKKSLPWIVLGE